MEPKGVRVYVPSLDHIGICTTPEEVWRAAKPDSIVEIAIPYEIEPAKRQAILDKIGDNPLVYVRDALPGEFASRPRAAPRAPAQRAQEAHVWEKFFFVSVFVLVLCLVVLM